MQDDTHAQQNAIYTGTVAHTRLGPRRHSFNYRVYMMYVNVEEAEALCKKSLLWSSHRRFWPAAFVRSDFHGNADTPLKQALQKTILDQTGKVHTGPIYMLANWRLFGINFNPLTTYYCFNEGEPNPAYIIAEVTNTPWRERHAYVLSCDSAEATQQHHFTKALHVSPFYPMNMRYEWQSNAPGENLRIQLKNLQDEKPAFYASLNLSRLPASAKNLNKVVILFPFMTVKVIAGIYWQALKLWFKRTPLFSHPKFDHPQSGQNKIGSAQPNSIHNHGAQATHENR